ncbi:Valyl-trna synthetase, partial [Globisporangium splendens]
MLRMARRPQQRMRLHGIRLHQQIALFSSLPHVPLPQELRARVKEAPLASAYDPAEVEKGWQAYWQDAIKNQSAASGSSENSDKFRMILPPPNVTGALHIGHALTITIQDALARWHRMRGFDVHWVPGLDHAGIATQSVVERKLQKEKNISKHDLGRDAFIDEVWKWNEQYGGKIMNQLDHIGAIVEKEQSYFTLDETRSKAVVEAFVQLHDKGLIYRRRRMVNWCPTLKTAISDIEVDSEQVEGSTLKTLPGRSKPVEFGVMHRVRYRVVDSDEFLEVDTTRPETIFGDVAVAIHPEDSRYQKFHGKYVLHPFSQEPIPIVTDDILVNMELGTGVVKVTPAHDPKDFECGLRNNLPEKEVIDKEGKICGSVDERFLGLDRYDAREKVVEELKDMGLYVDKVLYLTAVLDHPTAISICSRSGNVIEPLLMPQWFVDCKHMAKRAADNVRSGKMAIEPKSHAHTWFFFLDNMQDWCVSRQLWWGHRVPAYRVKNSTNDEWFVASSLEEAREKAEQALQVKLKDSDMEQDADVLDTWFSSGLLPLSVFGWPNLEQDERITKELGAKYPLDLMETGSDILFFWVARMAMLCEEFSGEIPFRKVLLHPMVRDKAGRKMSKSLGNVIDPLHVIDGISLDQLLADLARVVSYRHFCNKIWNAVRYALPLLETSTPLESKTVSELKELKELKDSMGLADRWIMSRLAQTVLSINKGIDSNHLATSVSSIQRFFVQELCDVYIEFSKPVLYGNRIDVSEFSSEEELRARKLSAQATMFQCLDYSMRLLHPFIPFVTEELWQRIREYDPLKAFELVDTSILFAKYPEEADMKFWLDDEAEKTMMLVLDVIHGIRSLKHMIKILAPNASTDSSVEILCKDEIVLKELTAALRDIEGQCRISVHATVDNHSSTVAGPVLTHSVSESCRVLMQVPQDPETSKRVESEISRLEKRVAKSQKTLDGLVARRSDPQYATKVPENVQSQDEQRLMQTETDLHATEKSLAALRELQNHY